MLWGREKFLPLPTFHVNHDESSLFSAELSFIATDGLAWSGNPYQMKFWKVFHGIGDEKPRASSEKYALGSFSRGKSSILLGAECFNALQVVKKTIADLFQHEKKSRKTAKAISLLSWAAHLSKHRPNISSRAIAESCVSVTACATDESPDVNRLLALYRGQSEQKSEAKTEPNTCKHIDLEGELCCWIFNDSPSFFVEVLLVF